jgi:hypothetical protein
MELHVRKYYVITTLMALQTSHVQHILIKILVHLALNHYVNGMTMKQTNILRDVQILQLVLNRQMHKPVIAMINVTIGLQVAVVMIYTARI